MGLEPGSVRASVQTFKQEISLRPAGPFKSNFIWSIIGVRERLHNVLGQIGSELLFPWHLKLPQCYNGENFVSTLAPPF